MVMMFCLVETPFCCWLELGGVMWLPEASVNAKVAVWEEKGQQRKEESLGNRRPFNAAAWRTGFRT